MGLLFTTWYETQYKGFKMMLEKTQEFFSFWWLKAIVGTCFAFVTSIANWFVGELNVNVLLFYLLCILFIVDFILGWIASCKDKKYTIPKFELILFKFLRYTYYIVLITIASLIIKWGIGYGFAEIFNGFIGFMAATELASITRHSDTLGIPIHPVIRSIIYAMPNRFKKHVEENVNPQTEFDYQESLNDNNLDDTLSKKE